MKIVGAVVAGLMCGVAGAQGLSQAGLSQADRVLARDVFKQLIEINSTDSVGNVSTAARAMRERLLAAGFAAEDLQILGPNDRKMNLVARYRGKAGSGLKPILVICHLDVVEAKREDWTTDPFVFTEKDGYFYGRGTQDIKEGDAGLVVAFIKMRREGYVPDRDIVMALTADEEGGKSNGVDWLERNHPELMAAEFVINPDAGGVYGERGVANVFDVEATEKTYADYRLTAVNKGGHSSLPVPDNAIYHVADALGQIERTPFPVELNAVTRAYLEKMTGIAKGQVAEDIRGVLRTPMDMAAVARLGVDPAYNSTLRTTCVATMLTAGHAPNALPQSAQANVNCRILPGHSPEEVRQKIIAMVHDPAVKVQFVTDSGMVMEKGAERTSAPPPPVNKTVQGALVKVVGQMWPGVAIVPTMEAGASDSIYTTAAGVPSYGLNGFYLDEDDVRAHGKDERLGVEAYYKGVEFTYRYLKALTE